MKTFDEKDIRELFKANRITREDFIKTSRREITIEEKSLETERIMVQILNDIKSLLTNLEITIKNQKDNASPIVEAVNEVAAKLEAKEHEEWNFEIERDRNGNMRNVIAKADTEVKWQ